MIRSLVLIMLFVFTLIACQEENIEVVEQQMVVEEIVEEEVVVKVDEVIEDEVEEVEEPITSDIGKSGTLVSESGYVCAGDFTLVATGTGVDLVLDSNFRADQDLPGYGMFLTNNPDSIVGALQVDGVRTGDVSHYSGARTFSLIDVGIEDYKYLVHWCVPFELKIGSAEIK